jgi:hypothetical protein
MPGIASDYRTAARRGCLPEPARRRNLLFAIRRKHLQKHVEVTAQNQVRRDAVPERRARALYEKLIQRLERHSSLRLRALIDCGKDFALADERGERRKQVGGDNWHLAEPACFFQRLNYRERICCAYVYGSDVRVDANEIACRVASDLRVVVRLNDTGQLHGAFRLFQKRSEPLQLFCMVHDG